ncbi:unnamed protein product [Brachionus calyciflorus]|uniref:Uncharacterized protein n=1 Tax=Brachionus calyciflorus TaxID=104777 RepID=A0A814KLA7_9BILA|nr:unnamed protein product [Brachionus calyciflorus]
MKLIILVIALSLAVVCHVKATTFNDLVREQLQDLVEAEVDSEELFQKRDKSYLTAQKHPEKLRHCVKCVGIHREKGMNVKQATSHCNKICRRELFDTREMYLRELNENDLF